jgi:hypothetical protein
MTLVNAVWKVNYGKAPDKGRAVVATCGLRISDSPTSDNLTPQETTKQDALEMGPDGAGSSCPGSSVVATEEEESN